MPYSKDNPPAAVKNLPKGAQAVFIDTFNGIVDDGGSEENARKAAWRNVKLKYKKQGDTWVKRIKSSQEGSKMTITTTGTFVRLVEKKTPDEVSKGVYRVIQAGWSSNEFYYNKDVTPQLVPFIQSKPMFFADHIEPKDKKGMVFGQKLREAVAVAEEAWADTQTGEVFVKLSPVGNPNTEWIYEASQKLPETIGLSIDAYGKIKVGEAEGKKGKIVEQFVGYDSTDFVYRPAAGGKFIALTEAIMEDEEEINLIESRISSFKDYIDKKEKTSVFFNLGYWLMDFLYQVFVWEKDEYTEEEKNKMFGDALDEFVSKLKGIDPANLFNADPIYLKTLENKLKENKMEKELLEAVKSFTPEELKVAAPDLFKAIFEQSQKDVKVSEELAEAAKVKKERDDLLAEVAKVAKERDEATAAAKVANDELKVLKEKEQEATWKAEVDKLIEESKIQKELITETFKNTLVESKNPDKVKSLIEDRKVVAGIKTAKGFDNGKTVIQQGQFKSLSDEDLAMAIRQ